ncbi:NADH dehydrogenase [Sorangium cellulosum]|uniref:NADH dehydrogenase n=1 Tax=Sorangium cellulosum TaxID=56 RepID=A0A4P2PW13_SORCE|nr:NADH dehydrogenase [Sorangium cellulosum]
MAAIILTTLALCPVAAWLGRRRARWARLLALWPLAVTIWLALAFGSVLDGDIRVETLEWIPRLGLSPSFRLDGLSGLFALLISGIGTGIVFYAAHYFDDHPYSGRFQATLFAFMAAMLGVVLTDNGLALFVFWELTGFTSYLLIGFEHEKPEARRAALQALIVTGAGGLALLAGAVLLSDATGSPSLLAGAADPARLREHALYLPIVLCFLLAAFTKSAQFPFQFWLPNAMAAPTPVSAYLHSAAMVNAGVYLVARMTPALGGTPWWTTPIVVVAGLTMLGGAARAVREIDMKKILAFTTVSALGTMMLLLALGAPACIAAGLLYLVSHALYKGTLFLVTGIVDHEAGTRDVTRLSGLGRAMPFTAAAGALAAASMAGLPPFLGFLAKEQAYTAVLDQPLLPPALLAVLIVTSALLGAGGLLVGFGPFFTGARGAPPGVHEAPPGLWLAPLVLGALSLSGVAGAWVGGPLRAAATAAAGAPVSVEPSLWHGFTLPLLASAVTLAATLLVYRLRERWRRVAWPERLGTERLYDGALRILDAISERLAPPLQDASLPAYVLNFIVTTTVLVGGTLALTVGGLEPRGLLAPRIHEVLVVVLIVVAALSAVRAKTTMTAVLSLGTAGYGVALTFALYGAPDLAMTQFAVETLTAVIFVYVFWQFPQVVERSSRRIRVRDGLISLACGTMVAVLTFGAAVNPTSSRLRDFYAEAAPTLAHGRNVVNVILVDFRALDTLGEITVLVTAAVGVGALLRIAAAERAAR